MPVAANPPSPIYPEYDLYFVGAIIALSCAIIAGGNGLITARLGHINPVVQVRPLTIHCSMMMLYVKDI
jgi:hypothetical protein